MEKGIPGKWTKKHKGVALPKFGEKNGLQTKFNEDKECHLIFIKRTIHQEDITIINIYTLKMQVSNSIKRNIRSKTTK